MCIPFGTLLCDDYLRKPIRTGHVVSTLIVDADRISKLDFLFHRYQLIADKKMIGFRTDLRWFSPIKTSSQISFLIREIRSASTFIIHTTERMPYFTHYKTAFIPNLCLKGHASSTYLSIGMLDHAKWARCSLQEGQFVLWFRTYRCIQGKWWRERWWRIYKI